MHDLQITLTLSLLGWSWGNPWMLAAVLAMGIPILIHLWSRRQYENVDWAAMRFLLQAVKENSRRFTIEQLILLTTRLLIFVVLAIALADPLLPGLNQAGKQQAEKPKTHHLIVIDGSYSMGYQNENRSAFDEARNQARRLTRDSLSGDAFTLVKLAEPPEVIIREPAFDTQSVQREIDNLSMTHGGGDLDATLAEIESIVARASRTYPELTQLQVTFYTDLGENTWSAVRNSITKQRLSRIAEGSQVVVHEIGKNAQINNAIVSVGQSPSRLGLGQNGQLSVQVRNFGSSAADKTSIEMIVDGHAQQTKQFSLTANGTKNVNFPVEFEVPGDHAVEFRLQADSLPGDDRWYSSVPIRDSIQVLCVDGRPDVSDNLAWALRPQTHSRNPDIPKIEIKSISAGALSEQKLSDFDCVALVNVPGFQPGEARQIHQFVSGGGGLLLFLGDAVRLDNYNQHLFENRTTQLLPGRLTGYSEYRLQTLDPLDYQHPIIEPFRGVETAGLLTTPIWKYIRLDLDAETDSQIVIAFQNQDPLITEQQVGFGKVVVFTSAGSGKSLHRKDDELLPWTEFQTWPSYVALIHEMLSYVVSGNSLVQNLLVGDVLAGEIQSGIRQLNLEMTGPKGHTIPLSISNNDNDHASSVAGMQTWIAGDANEVGFYTMRDGANSEVLRKYAVNLNTSESDTARIGSLELPVQFKTDAPPSPVVAPNHQYTGSMFQYILIALLGLLATESCLAWLFGREKK